MIADIDEENGNAIAEELGCAFEPLDVTDRAGQRRCRSQERPRSSAACTSLMLNAGIESPFSLGDDFDAEAYRRAMSINLDAVVYGFHAARPALIESGGGSVLATASLAGLAAMAPQPVYGANKAAVVALARALGPAHAHEGIRVNAICPGFADTAIITGVREALTGAGVPIIEPRNRRRRGAARAGKRRHRPRARRAGRRRPVLLAFPEHPARPLARSSPARRNPRARTARLLRDRLGREVCRGHAFAPDRAADVKLDRDALVGVATVAVERAQRVGATRADRVDVLHVVRADDRRVLVAADPVDRPDVSERIAQRLGDLNEQKISARVTESLADELKSARSSATTAGGPSIFSSRD